MGNSSLKKMKAIFVLAIIGYALAAQGTPAATSYCMGNNDSATTCSSCFNWNITTKHTARQFASSACATAVTNSITDCKAYSGTITTTKTVGDCLLCHSKDWMNITDNATAASIAITCSDTAISTTTCASTVSNCDQSGCFKSTAAAYTKFCRMCSSGYKPSGTAVSTVGYPSCVTGTITNATYYSSPTVAYECASGYAVASTGTSCTAYTTDSNCRKLAAGGWCNECKNSYYFSTTTCTLGAKMLAAGSMLLAAFFLSN